MGYTLPAERRQVRTTRVNSKALEALSFNINWRDTTTGPVPTFDQIGYRDMQDGQWPSEGGTAAWEHAHSPAIGLMPFMCRPSPCFIEIAQKAATWQRVYGNNDPSTPTLGGPSDARQGVDDQGMKPRCFPDANRKRRFATYGMGYGDHNAHR